jgi:hypothetical protein
MLLYCLSVTKSCAHFPSKTASLLLIDMHIVRTGGSINFSLSYGGSKRDCALFSFQMADRRDLNASLSFGSVHIVGTGGSNYFPMSHGGSNMGDGH